MRLAAGEWHGLMMAIAIVLQSTRGRQLLHDPLKRSKIKIKKCLKRETKDNTDALASDKINVNDAIPDDDDKKWTAICKDCSISVGTEWTTLSTDSVINGFLLVLEQVLAFETWCKKRDGCWESSNNGERKVFSELCDSNEFQKPPGQLSAKRSIRVLIQTLTNSGIC